MKILRPILLLLFLLCIACGYGSKVDVTDVEQVYYKGTATEEQARAVGETLTKAGFFDGERARSVQLLQEGDETVLRFVVKDGYWEDQSAVDSFAELAYKVSQQVFEGKEITVHLCDNTFKTKNSFPMSTTPKPSVSISENEDIFYLGQATEEQALAVGKTLTKEGLLTGKNRASIQLEIKDDQITLRYVMKDGLWENPEMVETFANLSYEVSQQVFEGKPIQVELADNSWAPQKSFPMEKTPSLTFGPDETLIYGKGVEKTQAQNVGKALQKIQYFTGKNTATVQLRKADKGFRVRFAVRDGFWEQEQLYPQWESLRGDIEKTLGQPVVLELCDSSFTTQKSFPEK